MKKHRPVAVATTLAALALLLIFSSAAASRTWCRADPVIAFDGKSARIWVEIPAEYESLVTGPIAFDVIHPSGIEPELLFTDDGFNGYGEVVAFRTRDAVTRTGQIATSDTVDVEFRASVPLDTQRLAEEFGVKNGSIPMRMIIEDPAGREHVVTGTNMLVAKSISIDLGTPRR